MAERDHSSGLFALGGLFGGDADKRAELALQARVKQRELLLQRAALQFEQEKTALGLRANPFDTIQYLMYMAGSSPTLPGQLPNLTPIPDVGGVENPPPTGNFPGGFNWGGMANGVGGQVVSPIRHTSMLRPR